MDLFFCFFLLFPVILLSFCLCHYYSFNSWCDDDDAMLMPFFLFSSPPNYSSNDNHYILMMINFFSLKNQWRITHLETFFGICAAIISFLFLLWDLCNRWPIHLLTRSGKGLLWVWSVLLDLRLISLSLVQSNVIGLYFHIPFCLWETWKFWNQPDIGDGG